MGTTYAIKLIPTADTRLESLHSQIKGELQRLNAIFSTYDDDSEISRLNRERRVGEYAVSEELWRVFRRAKQISLSSDGAFDITIAPLVALWGFGRENRPEFSTIEAELPSVKSRVGHAFYSLPAKQRVAKHHPDLQFDVSAIAKGYAVDTLSALLLAEGIRNFIVEIGGEIRAAGTKQAAEPWGRP